MTIYELVTNEIIEQLKKGVVPWNIPFAGERKMPRNFLTKNEYTGVNRFMLGYSSIYSDPNWLTFKQAEKLGGKVKKGTKGRPIIFAKMHTKTDSEGVEKTFSVYKKSTVFNLECIEGIETDYVKPSENDLLEFNEIKECESLINFIYENNLAAPYNFIQDYKACYWPTLDKIDIAEKKMFVSESDFYATLYHEIIHSTGHKNRVNRPMGQERRAYAYEELIAEIGASFICAKTGIMNFQIDNSASYIQGWLKALNNDHGMVLKAAAAAEKAYQYLQVDKHSNNI